MHPETNRSLNFQRIPSRREVWACRSLWLAAFALLLLGGVLDYNAVVMTDTPPSWLHLFLNIVAFALLVPWSLRHARLYDHAFNCRRPSESIISIVMLILLPIAMAALLSVIVTFTISFAAQGLQLYPYHR